MLVIRNIKEDKSIGDDVKKINKIGTTTVALLAAMQLPVAYAQVENNEGTDTSDVKVTWNNTVKYSAAYRVKDPSQAVAASYQNPNVDAGDLNFNKGFISDRLDLLSELNVAYKNVGANLSGAAWYDTEYTKKSTAYPASIPYPNTIAALLGGPNNQFTTDTKNLMGQHAEVANAFVYGKTEVGDGMDLSVRAGRLTQLYGESLFLGANAIAYAQGPVDLIKLLGDPSAQFKEIALPVGQVTANLQVNSNVSIGAYSQFEWRPLRLPPEGSYFNMADFVGNGADLLLTPTGGAANRVADMKGSNTGSFGGRVMFKIPGSDVEYGLYAAQYDDKAPIPVLNVTQAGQFGGGTYELMYAKNIKVYGASFSTLVSETNVAGEISTRRNTPLAPLGDLVINFNPKADNNENSPYAVGNSLHANLSAISLFPANALWDGATIVGEYAFNRLLSVTRDPTNPAFPDGVLNTTHTRDESAMKVNFQPEYFQVYPGVDLQVPISVGYGISGRSAIIQIEPEHGGDLTVGVNLDCKKTWRVGLHYTHFYGSEGPAPSLNPATSTMASSKQYFGDRDFVAFSVQRTF